MKYNEIMVNILTTVGSGRDWTPQQVRCISLQNKIKPHSRHINEVITGSKPAPLLRWLRDAGQQKKARTAVCPYDTSWLPAWNINPVPDWKACTQRWWSLWFDSCIYGTSTLFSRIFPFTWKKSFCVWKLHLSQIKTFPFLLHILLVHNYRKCFN